nr:site-specific integrase [uncultured Anaerotignum sp.]
MAKGENIYKRKDGRWEARYPKEYDAKGRICYGYCYGKTYREAKEKAAIARALRQDRRKDAERFSEYCAEWLRLRETDVKLSTYTKYRTMLQNHILPALGQYTPDAIRTSHIHEMTAKLLQQGYAPKTVRDILFCLRSIFRYLEKNHGCTFSAQIVYPRAYAKEMRVLTRAEQKRLTQYLVTGTCDPCKTGVLLSLFTGLRIGELCALRWRDIDLQNKVLRVCATMQRLPVFAGPSGAEAERGRAKTQIVITPPKSDHARRVIPLSENSCRICMSAQHAAPESFVLTGTEQYMEPRTVQYRMRQYAKACQLDGVHFHTLRHTFATRCIELGFDVKTLSEILGHANTTITLERYVHSSMELKRSNMQKLDKLDT